jgi:hypothetical protein
MNSDIPRRNRFLEADQDEVDAHFKWIADDLNLRRVEREVLGPSSYTDFIKSVGTTAIRVVAALIGPNTFFAIKAQPRKTKGD